MSNYNLAAMHSAHLLRRLRLEQRIATAMDDNDDIYAALAPLAAEHCFGCAAQLSKRHRVLEGGLCPRCVASKKWLSN